MDKRLNAVRESMLKMNCEELEIFAFSLLGGLTFEMTEKTLRALENAVDSIETVRRNS